MSDREHAHHHEEHTDPPGDLMLRVQAIESLLIEKRIIDPQAIDEMVESFERRLGPHRGARVVARAWVDPEYKRRLLLDGAAAIAELGISGIEAAEVVVCENTTGVHNLVVCTLCSCYPWAVLGLPPIWYKSPPYRARAVLEPRAVLSEFGLEIPASTEVRVWDSNAETRYLVLPMRPKDTEGLSEDELAALVTRDCMIGTGLPGQLPKQSV